jgi:hypothetical protein
VGRFSNNEGASACTNCPAGTESLGTGVSSCTSCKPGYYSDSGFSQCEPCDRGYFAVLNGSSQCVPCGKGYYSAQKGSTQCQACPQNTFGVSEVSPSEAACEACPDHSRTTSTASITVDQCICESGFYKAGGDCVECPVGALCEGQVCGLEQSATEGVCMVVGDWQRASVEGDRYFLHACPEGYMLINTPEGGTPADASSPSERPKIDHHVQRCVKCDPRSEYIILPASTTAVTQQQQQQGGVGGRSPAAVQVGGGSGVSKFSVERCRKCPRGLSCAGNATVSPLLKGAQWQSVHKAGLGYVYRLQSCPPGHYKSSGVYEFLCFACVYVCICAYVCMCVCI